MSTTEKLLLGSQTTLLSTELNSLAASAWTAAGSAFDNTQGATGDGYILCDIELVCTLAANATANTGFMLWLLRSQDGTNYEDTPTSTVGLNRAPDAFLPYTTGQTTTRVCVQALLPPGKFKPVGQNTDASHAMSASGNTIKIRPIARQQV